MDNKPVEYKSHLNAVCRFTYMGYGKRPDVRLKSSCGTEHFSTIFGTPSKVIGSDWKCDDPFELRSAQVMKILAGNIVVKCEFSRPFWAL